jgi:hypothetical protein
LFASSIIKPVEELLKRAALAGDATGFPRSGRDLSRRAIWAGIVAASEMIPAQINRWNDSCPNREAHT